MPSARNQYGSNSVSRTITLPAKTIELLKNYNDKFKEEHGLSMSTSSLLNKLVTTHHEISHSK